MIDERERNEFMYRTLNVETHRVCSGISFRLPGAVRRPAIAAVLYTAAIAAAAAQQGHASLRAVVFALPRAIHKAVLLAPLLLRATVPWEQLLGRATVHAVSGMASVSCSIRRDMHGRKTLAMCIGLHLGGLRN